MESVVVTLETAKQLKAAGFPQTYEKRSTQHWWESGYSARPFVASKREVQSYRDHRLSDETHDYVLLCAAPQAQEIADQLPEALNVIRHTGSWTATVDRGIGRPVVADGAPAMAEALAALWLRLHGETV